MAAAAVLPARPQTPPGALPIPTMQGQLLKPHSPQFANQPISPTGSVGSSASPSTTPTTSPLNNHQTHAHHSSGHHHHNGHKGHGLQIVAGSTPPGSTNPGSVGKKRLLPTVAKVDRPVMGADGVEGTHVTQTGTLLIEHENGQVLAVRKDGGLALCSTPRSPNSPRRVVRETNGRVRWEDLHLGRYLGSGAQGSVRRVKHIPTDTYYALKTIALSPKVRKKHLQLELSRILESQPHPNVVQSVEAFHMDHEVRILMEYMDCGSLRDVLNVQGFLPEPQLAAVARQILEGLQALHCSQLVHRDLKPENILLGSGGQVKIADFGVSTCLGQGDQFARTVIGTSRYMSPERVRKAEYDSKSDIWSVGLLVAHCALGVYPLVPRLDEPGNPFAHENSFDLALMLAEGEAKVNFDALEAKVQEVQKRQLPVVSPRLKDFVWACMHQEPKQRPTCKELLQHPFIQLTQPCDLKAFLHDHLRKKRRQLKEQQEQKDKEHRSFLRQESDLIVEQPEFKLPRQPASPSGPAAATPTAGAVTASVQ